MGAADIVPGVSGGTVALVLGVYGRLLRALSRFGPEALALLAGRQWATAWRHVDGGFLVTLGVGVGVGVKGLASLMTYLLTEQQGLTYAAFFGLILASGLLVARMARPEGPVAAARCVALGIIAAGLAVWLLSQGRLTPVAGLSYAFFCGAIAICAMILPGISGAYILLMLGKYEEVSGIVHRLPAVSAADAAQLAVFAAGCLIGLLLFSRLLRWLLDRHWAETMAVLAGFMLGSLYRVWPFQVDTTPGVADPKLKVFVPGWPAAEDPPWPLALGVALACLAAVLVVDAIANRHATAHDARG